MQQREKPDLNYTACICVCVGLDRGEIADTSAAEIPHRMSRGLRFFVITVIFSNIFSLKPSCDSGYISFISSETYCVSSSASTAHQPHTPHTKPHKHTLKSDYMLHKGKCIQTKKHTHTKGRQMSE